MIIAAAYAFIEISDILTEKVGFQKSMQNYKKTKNLNIVQILQSFTMSAVTISVRIDNVLHEEMKFHDEVNWSAVLRKSIVEHIKKMDSIDTESAKRSAQLMDKLRMSGVFDKGKPSIEIIREWRQKRK